MTDGWMGYEGWTDRSTKHGETGGGMKGGGMKDRGMKDRGVKDWLLKDRHTDGWRCEGRTDEWTEGRRKKV
jgi:hypothetical protein